ncbi:hypothetical protein CL658_04355 [bacterium]|nr:hypothetical protein [bacterium]|tara:strand:+ start:802 stop:1353 length:552 start_codon:yes stop_codon:yes gene_type:complete
MPTFFLSFVVLLFFFRLLSFAGHATFYDFNLDLYQGSTHSFLSKKIGVQHVFSDLSFRSLSVGDYYDSNHNGFAVFDLGYGRYWTIKDSYKVISTLKFELGYNPTLPIFFQSVCYVGVMRRLSSRFSMQLSLGVPFAFISQKSSFILSIGLNYFYGSGIAYREASDTLKQVRKKFLWFLWFYD